MKGKIGLVFTCFRKNRKTRCWSAGYRWCHPVETGDAHNNRQGTQIEGNTVTLNFKAFVQGNARCYCPEKSVQPESINQ